MVAHLIVVLNQKSLLKFVLKAIIVIEKGYFGECRVRDIIQDKDQNVRNVCIGTDK